MTDDPLAGVEPRYHSAMPDWVMLRGLVIRSIPVCEGGGFAIRRDQAMRILELIGKAEANAALDKPEATPS
jgi:hypothetical protein